MSSNPVMDEIMRRAMARITGNMHESVTEWAQRHMKIDPAAFHDGGYWAGPGRGWESAKAERDRAYWQDRRNWHSPGLHEQRMFRVGDIVTRDGSDLQRIDAINDAGDLIDVTCIRAPRSGWCKVGETESNIATRYSYPPELTIEGTVHAVER